MPAGVMARAVWLGLLIPVGACGTHVPSIREAGSTDSTDQLLVQTIAEKVRCEVSAAVREAVLRDQQLASVNGARTAPWFDSWGVGYVLRLVVEENTTVGPTVLWSPPSPASSVFTLASGLDISATATREQRMTFFYTVEELTEDRGCGDLKPRHRAQSLLAGSDLRLGEALGNYLFVVGTGAGRSGKAAFTDTVGFNVVTGGGLTPAWQLARVDVNRAGTLLGMSRDRTHELSVTYGPADPSERTLTGSAADQFRASQIRIEDD